MKNTFVYSMEKLITYYGGREKCYTCLRPQSSCMCKYINTFNTNTKFIILMHPKEFKKVKNNTGRFTHLNLENSELFVGIDFSHHQKINEIIAIHSSFILYPSEDAINLSSTNPKVKDDARPLAIFLIDSTWSCSKKMFNESKNLQELNHLSFDTTRESQYQIKQQPKKNYLSTIESTLVVLELLNTWKVETIEQDKLDTFLNPFYKMVAYQKSLIELSSDANPRFKRIKS